MRRGRDGGAGPARTGRPGRRVLAVVAGMMALSAVLRLADGAGLALAREIGAVVSSASAAPPAGAPAEEADAADLLAALRAREARLAEAEAALAARERLLAVADEEVKRGLAEMEAAEADLRRLLAIADEASEQDLARLTAIYEAMKPAEAAALFAEMEPAFAAGFLGRMRSDAAGPILAGLPPGKAYALSVILAGRHAGQAGSGDGDAAR